MINVILNQLLMILLVCVKSIHVLHIIKLINNVILYIIGMKVQ